MDEEATLGGTRIGVRRHEVFLARSLAHSLVRERVSERAEKVGEG